MYIHAKVTAGARKELLEERSKDHFVMSVKEPAERNMANIRVVELLSLHFNVSVKKVRIVNGHQSPSKLISVDIDE